MKMKIIKRQYRSSSAWHWIICDNSGHKIVTNYCGYRKMYSAIQAARRYGGRFGIDKVELNVAFSGNLQCLKGSGQDKVNIYVTAYPKGWYWKLTNKSGNSEIAESSCYSIKNVAVQAAKKISKQLNVRYTGIKSPSWANWLVDPTAWEKCVCNKTEMKKHLKG